uniref:Uncharacterized protein n=1 Tax=Arundo donax TaxID=35708 RepID=A0A0A9G0C5_ARUDO
MALAFLSESDSPGFPGKKAFKSS